MSEVLSQNEIDQLLQALNTGELDVDEMQTANMEKQVREYDFSRPAKFAKDHLRTLEIIYEHYGRLVSTMLPAHLRTSCQVEVINSEAVSYSEFSNALSNPILLSVLDFYPLKGSVVMEMSANIGYAIVDRLLGGQGNSLAKEREFTEIELAIIERILSLFVDEMIEPWRNVVELSPRLEKIETNPQFAHVISPNEIIALVTLSLQIGNVEGLMNICIPYITLEPIIDKLNTKYWFSTIKETSIEVYSHFIERQIEFSKIPIRAILGRADIRVIDFVNLQPGDIIQLDQRVDEQIEVQVGNIPKFFAKAGLSSGRNSVMVADIVRRESDDE